MNIRNSHYMPTVPSTSKRPGGIYPSPKQMASDQPIPNNDVRRRVPVITNTDYLQGYLRTQIGNFIKVNFLVGTGTFIDKEGILEEVGVDHIVLREVKTNDKVVADLYSIKFVEIPTE